MPAVSTPPRAASTPRLTSAAALPPLGRKVSRPLLGVGVVVVVLCALAFASVYSGAAERTLVLAVAKDVAPGDAIGDADLRDVELSVGPGIKAIPASDRKTVVGQRAAVALAPGSLLTRSQLAAGPRLAAGEALVPVALASGRFPPELGPGDTVAVVATAPGGSALFDTTQQTMVTHDGSSSGTTPVLVQAKVLSVRPDTAPTRGALISLVVDDKVAPTVLAAGAAGRVGLLLVGSDQ
ncbi:MAG: SAF domain-containing protein [Actinomycetota bacterium]